MLAAYFCSIAQVVHVAQVVLHLMSGNLVKCGCNGIRTDIAKVTYLMLGHGF
jgi:hypothetical protein